jgi:adenylate kinase
MKVYMDRGEVVPSHITFPYLERVFADPHLRSGFMLDGYPKNEESYDHLMQTLKKLQYTPLAAIHFELPRQVATMRLVGRLHCEACERDYHVTFLPPKVQNVCDDCHSPLQGRSDDTVEAIGKRLDVFEQKTGSVIARFKAQNIYHTIDASKTPAEVRRQIHAIIEKIARQQIHEGGSYYLRLPAREKSSVFHNHIDAESHELLRTIVAKVEEGSLAFENKIYPVSHLKLGPQVDDREFSAVYRSLPNFHTIRQATNEAFATGKMGDESFNYDQIRKTLQVAFSHVGKGVMTELEEETFAKTFDEEGKEHVTLNRGNTPYRVDWTQLDGYREKQIANVPRFELHHSIDISKTEGETTPPIDLDELSALTSRNGFQTGGWFIFRKESVWAYRSNEFTNQDYDQALTRLNQQAMRLREIGSRLLARRTFESTCSMEKVHAIWRVQ